MREILKNDDTCLVLYQLQTEVEHNNQAFSIDVDAGCEPCEMATGSEEGGIFGWPQCMTD